MFESTKRDGCSDAELVSYCDILKARKEVGEDAAVQNQCHVVCFIFKLFFLGGGGGSALMQNQYYVLCVCCFRSSSYLAVSHWYFLIHPEHNAPVLRRLTHTHTMRNSSQHLHICLVSCPWWTLDLQLRQWTMLMYILFHSVVWKAWCIVESFVMHRQQWFHFIFIEFIMTKTSKW